MMLYVIIPVYLLLVRTLMLQKIGFVMASVVAALCYFAASAFTDFTLAGGDASVMTPSVEKVAIFMVQLVVAGVLFWRIQQDEEALIEPVILGGLGLVLLYFIIPEIVHQVLF